MPAAWSTAMTWLNPARSIAAAIAQRDCEEVGGVLGGADRVVSALAQFGAQARSFSLGLPLAR